VPVADLPGLAESAILVPVSEAEPVVGASPGQARPVGCARGPGARDGLVPVRATGADHRRGGAQVAAAVAYVAGFDCRFRWHAVVRRGRALAGSRAVRSVPGGHRSGAHGVPALPAFGRAFAEVIPRLTVGDRPDGGLGALRAAEDEAAETARPDACHFRLAHDRHAGARQLAGADRPPARTMILRGYERAFAQIVMGGEFGGQPGTTAEIMRP